MPDLHDLAPVVDADAAWHIFTNVARRRRTRRRLASALTTVAVVIAAIGIAHLATQGASRARVDIVGQPTVPNATVAAPPRGALPVGTAFVGLDHNTGVVYALDANGHALRRLFTVAVEATHHWPTITQLQLGPDQTTLWYAANPTGVAPCSTITERNLASGATHGRYQGSWIALSPDGTRLAYTGCILQDPTVYITDLRTGRAWTARAPATALPVTSLGHLAWTPDSRHVLAEYLDGAQWKLANLTPSAQPGTISWGPTVLTLNNEDRLTTTPNALYVSAGTVTNTWSIDTYDWTYRQISHTPTTLAPLEIVVYSGRTYFMGGLATGGSSIDTSLYRLEPTGPPTQLRPGIGDIVTINATESPAATPRACRSSDLDLTMDPAGVSEATGQNTIVFRLANRASSPCRLYGYPAVRLLATNGQAFPFKFGTRGDMMLTTAKPAPIELAPGATAFGAVNKYRCDLGDKGRVTRIEVVPPSQASALATGLGYWATVGYFGYCGPGDPGSSVDIAPMVATPDKLLRSVAG